MKAKPALTQLLLVSFSSSGHTHRPVKLCEQIDGTLTMTKLEAMLISDVDTAMKMIEHEKDLK